MTDFIIEAKVNGVLGDHVNTDAIYPARYLVQFAPNEVRKHLFEDIDPQMAEKVKGGAIIGGIDFGCGSAREQGLTALKYSDVKLIICKSFSRAFYRNGFNNAVPLFIADCKEDISDIAHDGDILRANFSTGLLENITTGKQYICSKVSPFLIGLLQENGIWNYMKKHPKLIER